LYHINRLVCAGPLEKLKSIQIWVENDAQHGAAEYHWSKQWLSENGYNPEKAHGVEVRLCVHKIDLQIQFDIYCRFAMRAIFYVGGAMICLPCFCMS
jgi:hypothetical protein